MCVCVCEQEGDGRERERGRLRDIKVKAQNRMFLTQENRTDLSSGSRQILHIILKGSPARWNVCVL